MSRTIWSSLIVLTLLLPVASSAQGQDGKPVSEETVKRLMTILESDKELRASLRRSLDEARTSGNADYVKIMEEMSREENVAEMLKDVADIYRRNLTEEEALVLISFVRTPEGRRIYLKMGIIVKEAFESSMIWSEQIARKALGQ